MPLTPSFPPCKSFIGNDHAKRWTYTKDQFLELYRIAYFSKPKDRKALLNKYDISIQALSRKVGVTPENTDIVSASTVNMASAA
ncbi:MAG: hypothetical protein AB8B87_09305 [Granulosicoccus sp.]